MFHGIELCFFSFVRSWNRALFLQLRSQSGMINSNYVEVNQLYDKYKEKVVPGINILMEVDHIHFHWIPRDTQGSCSTIELPPLFTAGAVISCRSVVGKTGSSSVPKSGSKEEDFLFQALLGLRL